MSSLPYTCTSNVTLESLFQAYFDCRKNKRGTMNALAFETDYERNLVDLQQQLNSGEYLPGRCIAFMVDKPVPREIFAAQFRDRVVHHWLINQLNPLFEREFITDSYASRKGLGTHFGIRRASRFVRQCSNNYQNDCYVLKLDILSFFINIDRGILLGKLRSFIGHHCQNNNKELLLSLCEKIVLNDPTANCTIRGSRHDWHNFPKGKSLFHAKDDCGLPIGNLTSQVFANFYLNAFDHFVKHNLGIRYYGRYVDDFILVHESREHLQSIIAVLSDFLRDNLRLTLHPRKICLQHYKRGFNFLGATIMPRRIYVGRRSKGNFYNAISYYNRQAAHAKPCSEDRAVFLSSINSYLGLLAQFNTYRLRRRMLHKHMSVWWWSLMYVSGGYRKIVAKS
jgi:retron-type reverse transcriptase